MPTLAILATNLVINTDRAIGCIHSVQGLEFDYERLATGSYGSPASQHQ